jgi:uncharacterized protein (DUF2147 family)
MYYFLRFKVLPFFFLFMFSDILLAGDPSGLWQKIDQETGESIAIIKIWTEGGRLYGKVEKLFRIPGKDPNPVCSRCEGSRQNRPIVGMTIIWGLQDNGNQWEDGKILITETGNILNCKLQLIADGKQLEVKNYSFFSFFGSSQTWLRYN